MRRKILVWGLCFCLAGGIVRELWVVPRVSDFFVAQGVFIARLPQAPLIIFGANPWFESVIRDRFKSWFWDSEAFVLSDLESGTGTAWGAHFLLRISDSVFILQTDNARLLLFLDSVGGEDILTKPISYESDFWVVWNSEFIDEFPVPSQGVLYLTGRNPTKQWHQWSSENHIPLVSTDAKNSFRMSFQDDWKIFAD